MTVNEIEADGFSVKERIECLSELSEPVDIAVAIGRGIQGFANLFTRWRPDILVVLGDRFDMYAAAIAAVPFTIPIAHIHGGEVTEGAIDEALRHSMTKCAHLHFVSTTENAHRVRQLGEEEWRITVSGAPGLDNLAIVELVDSETLRAEFGFDMMQPTLLATFHPITLELDQTEAHIRAFLDALDGINYPIVFTAPNADTGNHIIRKAIKLFVAAHPRTWLVDNLGTQKYFSLMKHAAAMVGNSSSGIIEAASFRLPVVNVGNRQKGRSHPSNVIDVPCKTNEISAAIGRAMGKIFRQGLADLNNPYGDGHAAERICDVLRDVNLDDSLLHKHFIDLPEDSRLC